MLTVQTNKPFTFIKPVTASKPSKTDVKIFNNPTREELIQSLNLLGDLVALDIETNGKLVYSTESFIQGISLADHQHIFYYDKRLLSEKNWGILLDWIKNTKAKLIAHNVMYDSAFLLRDIGSWSNWHVCTYGMYKQLATEGFEGQSWGLKNAQIELLGWDSSNEEELDMWLINNKYIKSYSIEPKAEGYLLETENGPRYVTPSKSEMFNAPPEILGHYCGLDAAASYMLYSEVFVPSLSILPTESQEFFNYYHSVIFMTNLKLLVEQMLGGVYVDRESLKEYYKKLDITIEEKRQAFFNLPEVKAFNELNRQLEINKLLEKEPKKYKLLHEPKMPKQFKKNGEVSQGYLNYLQKLEDHKLALKYQEPTHQWQNWHDKLKTAEQEEYSLNINSGAQLRDFFYAYLKYPIILITESGLPAVDKAALKGFGIHGKVLKEYIDKSKEQSYVKSCIDITETTGYLHPQFRVPGTLTGRLAGSGGFNLQQQPKTREYLENIKAREGYVWVQADINSLEQVVLAELSHDPTLEYLYGSGVTNDVYLYNAANLKGLGEKVRQYYKPDAPTPESIALAKKECKKERGIAKVLTLSASYGAGPKKIHQTLTLDGVQISLKEVEEIHKNYWELYKGVKDYSQQVYTEWRINQGWVMNGLGRPLAVYKDKTKDLVNRIVQSTGHDCLMIANYYLYELKKDKPNIWYPIIIDYHDEGIVECKAEDSEEVMEMFREAYRLTNEYLGGRIKLVAEPMVVNNLADCKCES
jgi:DNA polymerase I-like protein with 3'-5' exonuclease and polymerase domains